MESFRLKNIIILILALTNLCLLGLLATRVITAASAREDARDQMVSLFAAEGVSLDPDLIPDTTPPAGLSLIRDGEEEQKLAEFLLGDVFTTSEGGGGIRSFQSSRGSAVFRADGSFDAVITGGGDDARSLCQAFCRAFHYEGLSFSLEGEDGTASATQTHDGSPVVNCTVTFTISGGAVETVSGTHLPKDAEISAGGSALSALSALNAFLDTIRDGAVATAVMDLYLCYELQSTTATPMALVPAWCVVTDTAKHYVNCYTGEVTAG